MQRNKSLKKLAFSNGKITSALKINLIFFIFLGNVLHVSGIKG
jgi:hypothetical protein